MSNEAMKVALDAANKAMKDASKCIEELGAKNKALKEEFDILFAEHQKLLGELQAMKALAKQDTNQPVAWITPDGEGFRIRFSPPVNDVPLGWDALYTTPPQPEQEQGEPVAWGVIASNTGRLCQVELDFAEVEDLSPKWVMPLYTAPLQRKPLTDEEIFALENSIPDEVVSDRDWCIHFARAIEAKLKENT
jgi:hypothetical protein